MTHASSILQLKRKAIAIGLCQDYKEKWNNSTTNKDLADLALDINGADFICASVEKEWGLTKEFILNNFTQYINGKYIAGQRKDYTSEIFVGYNGEITARTTILIILYSNAIIHIPQNHACKIFAAKNSMINITCDGYCELINYTPTQHTEKHGSGHLRIEDPHTKTDSWINLRSKNE